jgi:hypothetical protein
LDPLLPWPTAGGGGRAVVVEFVAFVAFVAVVGGATAFPPLDPLLP